MNPEQFEPTSFVPVESSEIEGPSEEEEDSQAEKQERMANLAVAAIQSFCIDHGTELDPRVTWSVRSALAKPGGQFSWTPSVPAFKRIIVGAPSDFELQHGWDGKLAVVVENGTDSMDAALTDELNELLHERTHNFWLNKKE